MQKPPISGKEQNEINKKFWAERAVVHSKLLDDKLVAREAFAILQGETDRQIDIRARLTLECAMENVDRLRSNILIIQSEKGGRAEKGDPLTKLIESYVKAAPNISEAKVLEKLSGEVGFGPIIEIDNEEILVEGRNGIKPVPLSALKDRVSRAKKKLNSR